MMEDMISPLLMYAPLFIFAGAFLDVLVFTGLFLYGGTMLATVALLYASGAITATEIVIAASTGTLLGSSINFYLGRFFGHVPFIAKFLEKPGAQKIRGFMARRHLLITMTIGRFITLARPLYGLVLGTMEISPRRFFMYEIPLVLVWVVIWLVVLIQGERLYQYFIMM